VLSDHVPQPAEQLSLDFPFLAGPKKAIVAEWLSKGHQSVASIQDKPLS
jgi:hypothetical protein